MYSDERARRLDDNDKHIDHIIKTHHQPRQDVKEGERRGPDESARQRAEREEGCMHHKDVRLR